MNPILIILLLLSHAITASSNDSITIRFLNKKILLDQSYTNISLKKQTVLLVSLNNDTIQCFIFKKNQLKETGKLIIVKQQSNKIGLRNGYWLTFDKNKKQHRTYYIEDEPLLINDKTPIKDTF